MTEEEYKGLAREFARALSCGDSAALEKLTAPNFIHRLINSAPGFPTLVERDEFVNELPKLSRAVMPNGFNFVVGTTIAEGAHVAMQVTADAMTAQGKRYTNDYHWYIHFDGDRIDEFREFLDGYRVTAAFDADSWSQTG